MSFYDHKLYDAAKSLSLRDFAAAARADVLAQPERLLKDIREFASLLGSMDNHAIEEEDAERCLDKLRLTAADLNSFILDNFLEDENVRWLFGRALDRIGMKEEALEHIRFVSQVADIPDLRARAFARLAEINLSLGYEEAAYEAAFMADHVEDSPYCDDLLNRAEEALYDLWEARYGPLFHVGNG